MGVTNTRLEDFFFNFTLRATFVDIGAGCVKHTSPSINPSVLFTLPKRPACTFFSIKCTTASNHALFHSGPQFYFNTVSPPFCLCSIKHLLETKQWSLNSSGPRYTLPGCSIANQLLLQGLRAKANPITSSGMSNWFLLLTFFLVTPSPTLQAPIPDPSFLLHGGRPVWQQCPALNLLSPGLETRC